MTLVRLVGGPANGRTLVRIEPLPKQILVPDPRAQHKRLMYRRQQGTTQYSYEESAKSQSRSAR
jgi:hypothetical protein